MKRWLDSLFGRIFVFSLATSMTIATCFSFLLMQEKSNVFARATAPLWAAALQSVDADLAGGSATIAGSVETVSTRIRLIPGPPPPDATALPLMPRYLALKDELLDLGVPVRQLRVSGATGESVTWLELGSGERRLWVGIPGELEGADRRRTGTLRLLLAVSCFLLAAWWLSRRIARPLAALEAHLQALAGAPRDGEARPPLPEHGPLEVRQLIRRYNQFAAERQVQDEERNMMLAGLSHDLRSPLARIRMAAALLPDEDPGVRQRREVIVRNVAAADQLLGSFLDLGRSAAEPMRDSVDLRALAAQACAASGRDDVLLLPNTGELLVLTHANRLGLQRALHNLLDNGIKYGTGPFEIAVGAAAGRCWISVRDHGPGIAAGQRERLMRPFFRGDHGRGLPGAGLGLAIAGATAMRHGGRLELSDAAPGLRATLSFPLQ